MLACSSVVEQGTVNAHVAGSIPAMPAKKIKSCGSLTNKAPV